MHYVTECHHVAGGTGRLECPRGGVMLWVVADRWWSCRWEPLNQGRAVRSWRGGQHGLPRPTRRHSRRPPPHAAAVAARGGGAVAVETAGVGAVAAAASSAPVAAVVSAAAGKGSRGHNAHADPFIAALARAMQTARATMERYIAADRLRNALSHPGTTVTYVDVGQEVWFHLQKRGWLRGIVHALDRKTVYIRREGALFSFHEARTKP